MGFIKNLKFAMSDEFTQIRKLLIHSYHGNEFETMVHSLENLEMNQRNLSDRMDLRLSAFDDRLVSFKKEQTALFEQYYSVNKGKGVHSSGPEKEDVIKLFQECLEQKFRAEMSELKHQNTELTRQNQEIKNRLEQILEVICQTKETDQGQDISNAELELNQYKLLYKQLENEKSQLYKKLEGLSDDYSKLKLEAETIKTAYLKAVEEVKVLNKKIEQLNSCKEQVSVKEESNIRLIFEHKDHYLLNDKNIKEYSLKINDMSILEDFFETIPESNSYRKMYEKFKKNMKKVQSKLDEEDEVEDVLIAFINVIESDLLKKIMVAIYRGLKFEKKEFELKLLNCINAYLNANSFYVREDIAVGNIISDKDYDDMELIKDSVSEGKQKGEITEIELYPYYINFINEYGEKCKLHTQGNMIVVG